MATVRGAIGGLTMIGHNAVYTAKGGEATRPSASFHSSSRSRQCKPRRSIARACNYHALEGVPRWELGGVFQGQRERSVKKGFQSPDCVARGLGPIVQGYGAFARVRKENAQQGRDQQIGKCTPRGPKRFTAWWNSPGCGLTVISWGVPPGIPGLLGCSGNSGGAPEAVR